MPDTEIWKLIASQGIGFVVIVIAVKWLLKDRERILSTVSDAQKERITLLESISANRTNELIALRSEFSEYRAAMQREISAIYSKHSEQLISVTGQYNKQLEGLQTEIRGLYKILIEVQRCPITDKVPSPDILEAGS